MKEKKSFIQILFSPFMYFFLGCYYVLFGLFYPIYFLSKAIGDLIFNAYTKKNTPQTVLSSNVSVGAT